MSGFGAYNMKGEPYRLRLSRRTLDDLSTLLNQTLNVEGGPVPNSVTNKAADELLALAERRGTTETRYVVNLGVLERETCLALRDCLLVIASQCCHVQVQRACVKKAAEIATYLGVSAVDRLGDIIRESA